jgi:AraC-like DNA-binding protein
MPVDNKAIPAHERLIFALERIADGMSVGDAAFSVGFENPSSFIALFKRQFGKTPGRYFDAEM